MKIKTNLIIVDTLKDAPINRMFVFRETGYDGTTKYTRIDEKYFTAKGNMFNVNTKHLVKDHSSAKIELIE